MALATAKKNPKVLVIVGIAILFGLYQLASPFLEETSRMEEESKKLGEQIDSIQKDSAFFSKTWEEEIVAKEKELNLTFPEKISTQSIIRYFGTDFEKTHAGVSFTNLLPASPSVANIKVDPENPNIKPRVVKTQIKAFLPPQMLLEYLEYVEKYPGVWDISDFTALSVSNGKKSVISMDVSLDLYMQPKDWVKKEDPTKKLDNNKEDKRELAGDTSDASPNQTMAWFETEDLKEKPVDEEAEKKLETKEPPKPVKLPPPAFTIKQFMGTGIVVGDDLYEEGDAVEGWRVIKINKIEKFVILKKSTTAYKVVIP